MDPTILALIPARGGSKGVPRKNILPIAGKPLIAYSILQALASKWNKRVVASLVISGVVGAALAGSRLSSLRLAATMAISQLLFHGLFSSLGAPVTLTHAHAAMPIGLDAPAHHHAGTMWLAHASAGLIAFLAYRFGEAAFFGLATTAALLLARLTRVLVPVVVTPSRVSVTPIGAQPSYLIPLLSSSVSRRGPPLGVAGA